MSATFPAVSRDTLAALAQVRSREQLSASLTRISAEIDATHYLLLGVVQQHGAERPHILASNWIYDTISLIGLGEIDRLAGSEVSTTVGEIPVAFEPAAAAQSRVISPAVARILTGHGHGELCCLRLASGARRCRVIFSAATAGTLDASRLPSAQLASGYLVSRMDARLLGETAADSLSDRERECLHWVSEGKTTEEVALILGVTANTVNSYIANAMQKFGAANRAMAVATAIRTGAI